MAKRGAKPAYVWYAGVGRWRLGSRWASKPKPSQLRVDKRGRYLDSRGRAVPKSAVQEPKRGRKKPGTPPAKKKAPPKKRPAPVKTPRLEDYAKPREWVWDGAGKRWRVDGKFAGPPPARELKRDDMGRMVDSRGVRVPVSAVRDAPVREVKPKPVRMERLRAGDTVVAKEFISSTFKNRKPPEDLASMFENVLERHAAKGPFESKDIVIYEHGIKYVGPDKLSPTMIQALEEIADEAGFRIKMADTRVGTEVYAYLGEAPKIGGMLEASFTQHEEAMRRIYDQLLDYWGELDWYVWAEADESLYG